MLKTNGLDWLARNAGSGDCFAASGISYRDADGVLHTGGTKDVVNAFVVADMVDKKTVDIIAGTNYNEFKLINDGTDLSISDVKEADDRSAAGGTYPQYCVSAVTPPPPPPPPPPGGKPTTRPLTVYVGGTLCPPGAPSVDLDTTGAFAYYTPSPVPNIGVGAVLVHNHPHGDCYAYFTWVATVWSGVGYTTCPTHLSAEMVEISRYLVEPATGRPISTTRLLSDETDTVWASFEVPASVSDGDKTICMTLWGNYDKDALIAELNTAGYYDKT